MAKLTRFFGVGYQHFVGVGETETVENPPPEAVQVEVNVGQRRLWGHPTVFQETDMHDAIDRLRELKVG